MFSTAKFFTGMAAGMVVGAAACMLCESRGTKTMYRRLMRSPVGRSIRSIGSRIG